MIQIMEVNIISLDRGDEISWDIEGEITFEGDINTPFSALYIPDDDEFEDLTVEMEPDDYDARRLKRMILRAADKWEE